MTPNFFRLSSNYLSLFIPHYLWLNITQNTRCRYSHTCLWTVGIIKHPEDDPGHGVGVAVVMGRRQDGGDVVLQGLAQHTVEGEIRPHQVLLGPVVTAQLPQLSPKAVQVLKTHMFLLPKCYLVNKVFKKTILTQLHKSHFNHRPIQCQILLLNADLST